MLLKSLKLKDFRQFKGNQSISFSTDPNKNVTVIMGENGSGKTTFAQAFTWCLYGNTDFSDKQVLCKATAQNMLPNSEEYVRVELKLIHNNIEYLCIREQRYSKDSIGKIRANNTNFKIAYKGQDGQREYLMDAETELRVKEILPKELSRYFFFDGERIGNMSKEISKGKSAEFSKAVQNLLGLSAIQSALTHLGSRTRTSVIKLYNDSYDVTSNTKIAKYVSDIDAYEKRLEEIDTRLEAIEKEEEIAREKASELEQQIRENAESEQFARDRDKYKANMELLTKNKASSINSLLKNFNSNAHSYFAKRMINDALQQLSSADKIDKGVPGVNAKTIDFLIKRGKCICGADIEFGEDAYKHLNELLEFIPPHSIGTLINQFVHDCELRCRQTDTFFDDILTKYSFVRNFESEYTDLQQKIAIITQRLEGMKKVGELQSRLSTYQRSIRALSVEKSQLNQEKGIIITKKNRCEKERNELTLKDTNNRKIEIYKLYAQYMYDTLNKLYSEKETETRNELEETINEIFKKIYNGGFSLSIDEKYNIQVLVNDFEGFNDDIETSTAQSISVIFAFIAGVIKMARKSQNTENGMLVSEPYPLVMDAPLSAFDKKRIQTVCEVLPSIAEQVIIFIKDTDGELAETYMSKKVGCRYSLEKKNEFVTYLELR